MILPLDQFVSADGSGLTEAIFPYLLDHFRSDGGLFALPVDASPTMIHYDPRIFAKHGVSNIDDRLELG